MVIEGALANCNGVISLDEFLSQIRHSIPSLELYKFDVPDGVSMKGAADWRIKFNDLAVAITIFGFLWDCYKSQLQPHQEDANRDAGISIQIRNANNDTAQIMLGKDINDKEIFISSVTKHVTKLKKLESDNGVSKERSETTRSDFWVKFK